MKYAVLSSIIVLNVMSPALGEEETLEFKSETAQVIEGDAMVFPFESTEIKKNLKNDSKKIDFFSVWKNKIHKTPKTSK